LRVQDSSRLPRIAVTSDGQGIVSHAGIRLLVELAERLGLTAALSKAMAPTRTRRSAHDPGTVLVHLAAMLADGGDCLSDLHTLRDQEEIFGPVASDPTAWRVVDSVTKQLRESINQARAEARARAWSAGARPEEFVLDLDATLLDAHSDKRFAAATYKKGFGFASFVCYLDATGEALAGMLRGGNASPNTASNQITVLDDALAQLPVATKAADPDHGVAMLLRADSASATHDFIDALRARTIEYSIGFPQTEGVRTAVLSVEESAWRPCLTQAGKEREGAECTEITHLLDLRAWPEGTRVICRREDPHPGAQLTFSDAAGHRFQCFATDTPGPDIVALERRHRAHARVEDRIRCAKDTGLANLPFHDFASNNAWMLLVLIAQDLIAWAQQLLLDGELARAEPKRLRYALWHTAGRLVRHGRHTILRLARAWPWAETLVRAFTRLRALPEPT
jgi:hypothetical protein